MRVSTRNREVEGAVLVLLLIKELFWAILNALCLMYVLLIFLLVCGLPFLTFNVSFED